MKKHFIFTAICLSLLSAACNTVGEPVEFSKACSPEYEKKTVEVSGFLSDKGGIFCSNIGGGPVKCGFKFTETPVSEKSISADIVEGAWANNVEKLERGYKKEDIKIHDNDGNIVNITEKVKITGTLNTTGDPNVCFISVAKITK
jgi:hypothetical protein